MRHYCQKRIWVLFLLLAALVAAHEAFLYRLASHFTWTIALALVLLVLLSHSGILGSIYAAMSRRSRDKL